MMCARLNQLLVIGTAQACCWTMIIINNKDIVVIITAVRVSAKSVCYLGTSQAVVLM